MSDKDKTRINRVITRTGDRGDTGLADGSRVSKWHPRIQVLGELDELNSALGVLRARALDDEATAKAEEMVGKAREQSQEILSNAQRQANETLDRARDEARAEGDRIVAAAREEVDQAVASASNRSAFSS